MTNWNLDRLLPMMLDCGRMALSYFDYPIREYKDDNSIVTLADKSIEAFLTEQLARPSEGVYLLGEETIAEQTEDYLANAFRHKAWIIDPIDGTAPFANNLPNWGVSVGFMDAGVLKEGAVFLAALGELYYTKGGKTLREKLGTDPDLWLAKLGQPVELRQPSHSDLPRGCMISISQQLARDGDYRLPFYVQVTGSSVFNMVRLASGSYGACITKFKIWDFAACLPMLANLGWTLEFHSGGPMSLVMDSRSIHLAKGHPNRWGTLDNVIMAPSPQAAEVVRQGTAF
jgi:fructose-1,6-bisphosphatase/inositol monophosphatase family enzyme